MTSASPPPPSLPGTPSKRPAPRRKAPSLQAVLWLLLLGLPVLLIGLVVMTGSVGNAAALLFVSVVCTAGIGGVFWLALALLIGWMLNLILPGPLRRPLTLPATGSDPMVTRLTTYAGRAQQQGMAPERIRRDLARGGWSSVQIEAALADSRPTDSRPADSHPTKAQP
ncbi:hypothetical protein H8F24_18340 [Synechococcus sp. CBW1002]|uniref:hypothetical protein n=1 Tax=unclassified Synechococcus TaxID=2626047 RepID=UPI0018CF3219|nr:MULTISPECIES: hypothetical protein [unclassified Synechococcus]QPN59864.1 hypothetical protein H8F24_18340 [Synechococcus sp. CBW1002]QPN66664.1 hypothetical protein H8F26_18450 [Synechococcus sp. CBW1006]